MIGLFIHRWWTWWRFAAALWLAIALGVASWVSAAPLDPQNFTSLGTLDLSGGNFTIDTDALTITDNATSSVLFTGVADDQGGMASPNSVPEIAVFTFDEINFASTAQVSVVGSRALALLSHDNATIDTTLDVSGGDGDPLGNDQYQNPAPPGGPGGFGGGDGDTGRPAFGPGAGGFGLTVYFPSGQLGGGGGFGSDGLDGHPPEDTRGFSYGDLTGVLQGGSGGGGTLDQDFGWGATGGGGGGALEIGAVDVVTVGPNGALAANGGTGGSNYLVSDAAAKKETVDRTLSDLYRDFVP
jgi:hypothetical protein